MTQIFRLEEIKQALDPQAVIEAVAQGFVLYSQGQVVVPPVGHLAFEDPPGDVHIKYGYIRGDDYYVIKIASGFYRNPARGLPVSDGCMLVYEQQTGRLLAILLDEGYLTDLRTAAAGAVAARHLGPQPVEQIGIVGTGTQARFQLDLLRYVTDCREVMVWGRSIERLVAYKTEMEGRGFRVRVTMEMDELLAACNLIVTTTPAERPLIPADRVRPGTHITALGSDGEGKQELEPALLERAARVVADSYSQCSEYGETSHALRAGLIAPEDVVELGDVVAGKSPGRTQANQITIADLTGVAIQDIQVAKMAYEALR